jgi:hypothetical protein
MIRCLNCDAETSNGLALCELCQRFASTVFDALPIYFRNLARWKPGRAGSRPVPGSRVLYDGVIRGDETGDRISDRLDEAANALTTWARALVKDRPHFPRPLTFADAVLVEDPSPEVAESLTDDPAMTAAGLCAAFAHHLTSIATLEWCGEFVRDLTRHEAVLRGLTESAVPGWYAGACRQVAGFDELGAAERCGVSTYVVPGLTWVTCGGCGATTSARDHLEVILAEARDWVDRPKLIAGALVALLDGEQSVDRLYDRIRKWESLGWLESIRKLDEEGDETGPKRYRLGDVLDLVNTPPARRMTAV